MMTKDDLLGTLNPPQRQAVTTIHGPVLILAGPGSGKTRVITHRVAYLVRHEQVKPWNVLAVTFTNRAAKEMRERLDTLVGPGRAKTMTIRTFHSLCASVLRQEGDYLAHYGMNAHYMIYDQKDQLQVLKRALDFVDASDLFPDTRQPPKPGDILEAISRAKSHMRTPERMAELATKDIERLAARVYPHYNQLLRARNALDFDDLLLFVEHLWRSQPERLQVYQHRYLFIHVDEFQDCNLPQYKLVRLLGYGTEDCHKGLGNVCVVGDDDQMIYTWRGASAENVVRFERDFPQTTTILLEQNYRSTQMILDAAQNVVRQNRQRKEKHLWTAKQGGELLSLHVASDDIEEARAVARAIKQLKEQRTVTNFREIAVLYRMNAQSRSLEQQLRLALIPYIVIGSRSFWERKEIKDVLAYVRVVANPADDVALERILNVPNRGLGQQTIGRLRAFADEHKLSLSQAISDHLAQIPKLTARAKTSLLAFRQLLAELVEESRRLPLPEFMDSILEKTGYQQELVATSTEDIDRAANVSELRRVAEEFVDEDLAASLQAFLEHIALIGSADTMQTGENGKLVNKQQQDCVHLITLHASKGLEFPVICIVGCDEAVLPHSRASFDQAQMEEERRLAYVGFTRAMDHLLLFRAERRYVFGEVRDMDASRFLDDIPSALITNAGWWFGGASTQKKEQDEWRR